MAVLAGHFQSAGRAFQGVRAQCPKEEKSAARKRPEVYLGVKCPRAWWRAYDDEASHSLDNAQFA